MVIFHSYVSLPEGKVILFNGGLSGSMGNPKKVSHYREDRGFWNTTHVARTFSVCLRGCLKQVSSAMTGLVAYMIS